MTLFACWRFFFYFSSFLWLSSCSTPLPLLECFVLTHFFLGSNTHYLSFDFSIFFTLDNNTYVLHHNNTHLSSNHIRLLCLLSTLFFNMILFFVYRIILDWLHRLNMFHLSLGRSIHRLLNLVISISSSRIHSVVDWISLFELTTCIEWPCSIFFFLISVQFTFYTRSLFLANLICPTDLIHPVDHLDPINRLQQVCH